MVNNNFDDTSFRDNSWKRHLDFDSDSTISVELLEEQKLEKKFGAAAKELIGVFAKNIPVKLNFNPYATKAQHAAARKIVRSLGITEAKSLAMQMISAYKDDPKYCPRILMPTQMAEKMGMFHEYVKNKDNFKKKSYKTSIIS